MSERVNARICNKHNLEVNWLRTEGFIPLQGELIIYDREIDATGNVLELPTAFTGRVTPYTYERVKVGDGITDVNSLPFLASDEQMDLSGYATKDDIKNFITEESLVGYATEGYVNEAIADNIDTPALNSAIESAIATAMTTVLNTPGSCTISGGELSAGAGSVYASGTNINISEVATPPTSGSYITVSGSGSVSRAAVTNKFTAGYIPDTPATTIITSITESSSIATKYYVLEDNGKPIEVDSIDSSLTAKENVGKVYKCDDKLYQVNKITSLKGLTIKFNTENITPCPVISEDAWVGCSGKCASVYADIGSFERPSIKGIGILKRDHHNYESFLGSDIAFEVMDEFDTESGGCYVYYGQCEGHTGWRVFDYNGNDYPITPYVKSVTITQFDCPDLNEDPAFIEWVMANAKAYSKIENVSDIKGIRFSQDYTGDFSEFISALQEINNTFHVYPMEASGTFIATFSIDGEQITKTFSTFFTKYYPDDINDVVAYFSDGESGENCLCFEFVEHNEEKDWTPEYNLKYNDVPLDVDGVTFTTFDAGDYDKSFHMVGFFLSQTDITAGYAAIQEFITTSGTLEITENGKVDVKGYEKAEVNVVEINEGFEIAILGGAY